MVKRVTLVPFSSVQKIQKLLIQQVDHLILRPDSTTTSWRGPPHFPQSTPRDRDEKTLSHQSHLCWSTTATRQTPYFLAKAKSRGRWRSHEAQAYLMRFMIAAFWGNKRSSAKEEEAADGRPEKTPKHKRGKKNTAEETLRRGLEELVPDVGEAPHLDIDIPKRTTRRKCCSNPRLSSLKVPVLPPKKQASIKKQKNSKKETTKAPRNSTTLTPTQT